LLLAIVADILNRQALCTFIKNNEAAHRQKFVALGYEVYLASYFESYKQSFFSPHTYRGYGEERRRWGCAENGVCWDDRHPPEHDTTLAEEKSAGHSLALTRYFVVGNLTTDDALAFVPDSLVQKNGREKTPEICAVAKDISGSCQRAKQRLLDRLQSWVV
jgi:hypothetical protein